MYISRISSLVYVFSIWMAVIISFSFRAIVFLNPMVSYRFRASCCVIELNPCLNFGGGMALITTALMTSLRDIPQWE